VTNRDVDRMIERARDAAEYFWAIGMRAEAETIRSLCRSRVAARETNRRLAADNRKLRQDFEKLCADRPE